MRCLDSNSSEFHNFICHFAEAADNRILVSHAARCRLSADVEACDGLCLCTDLAKGARQGRDAKVWLASAGRWRAHPQRQAA